MFEFEVRTQYVIDGEEKSESWVINNLKSILDAKSIDIKTQIIYGTIDNADALRFTVLRLKLKTREEKLDYIANDYKKFYFIREGIRFEFKKVFRCSVNRIEKFVMMRNNTRWLIDHYYNLGKAQYSPLLQIRPISDEEVAELIKKNAGQNYVLEEADDPRTWNCYADSMTHDD